MARYGKRQAPRVIPRTECSHHIGHKHGPDDYVGWQSWAEEMSKTHIQKQCPVCQLWLIWEKKEDPE